MIVLFSRVSISLAVSVDSCRECVDLHTLQSISSARFSPVPYKSGANYPGRATGELLQHVQFPVGAHRVSTEAAQAIRKCRGRQSRVDT